MSEENTSIVQLDRKTVNKIAAGEVVERPASVVKELIENSIDAGATDISVYIEEFGLDLIKIVDNGKGMSKEDAKIAWKSHTTSKLKTVEDLSTITSLGFRGEALASIAAVSMMEIITRRDQDPIGTRVKIKGGVFDEREEVSCAPGTTIIIKNLFFNVPARKKFLKTKTTELAHIIEVTTRQALIHYDIQFHLTHNKNELLNSPRSNNPLEPLIAVFGIELAKQMIPIEYSTDGISITGFTSIPSLTRATREHEMLYINKRYIKSQLISEAVESAYRTLVMKHRYPVCLLNVELDSSLVDVNVHPTKREVRFGDAKIIFTAITDSVSAALSNKELWRESKTLMRKGEQPISVKQKTLVPITEGHIPETKILTEHEKTVDITQQQTQLAFDKSNESKIVHQDGKSTLQPETQIIRLSSDFWIKPLGQALKLYILCETQNGIALVDLHATHERIRYEQLTKIYLSSKIELQELLQPITFKLSPERMNFLTDYLPDLEKIGITLEAFGGNTYIIRKMPVMMDLIKTESDILDFFDEMKKETAQIKEVNERLDAILKTMACHSVVRSGDVVSMDKIRRILTDLSNCQKPFTCPHGRPTIIKITQKDLEKEFGRIV
ncbi:MAG: DNA mismatch repair endonuclease MutL [Candidatus Heimdallarchaeota archaeon]